MGLPAYHKIIGLGSWQQLSSDEGMILGVWLEGNEDGLGRYHT